MKKIIIWGINVIVIILTVFLVSCIIRNNANRSNDIKTQKNTVTVKETVQDGNYSIGFYSYEKKIRNKTKKCWIPFHNYRIQSNNYHPVPFLLLLRYFSVF